MTPLHPSLCGAFSFMENGFTDYPRPQGEGGAQRRVRDDLPVASIVAGVQVALGRGKSMLVSPDILRNARELRFALTDAEKLLWFLLRNRQFFGLKFRRQQPFGRFILDFYCHEARVAIELDGAGHADDGQIEYDKQRTRELEDAGIRVLRFWNDEVLRDIESVLEAIFQATAPSPGLRPPSPGGRG